MRFDPDRFRRYARDLSIAVYELSKEKQLALELKGLKAKAIKARSHIDALNSAYDKFNEDAPAHAADVASLTEQISGMQDDLQFAVTTLGNSVGEQEKPIDKPKDVIVVKPDEVGTADAIVTPVVAAPVAPGFINLIPTAPKDG